MKIRSIGAALSCALLLTACGIDLEEQEPELVDSNSDSLVKSPLDKSALLKLPSDKSPPSQALKVEQLHLRLTSDKDGVLGLELGKRERERVIKENGRAAFEMSLNPREKEVVIFNDLGEGPDLEPGDGVFSASVPIDLDRLHKLNVELSELKTRTLTIFEPGSRVVSKRIELPKTDVINIPALKKGATLRLPNLGEIGPLRTLGGVTTASINPQKSLLIRSLPVIEDPARTRNPCDASTAKLPHKKWTFGHLMEQMAIGSGLTASEFVEKWLDSWRTQQIVTTSSGSVVLDATSAAAAASVESMIIDPWRQRSGGGALDLSIAPFRLQAILYRPDLAQSSPYGFSAAGNNGGELRFVFGMMEVRDGNGDGDARDAVDTCQPIEAAVIFEYGVPLSSCSDIKAWANEWVNLSSLLPGDPSYGATLESLTEKVVTNGAAPTKPNQNALNQLRTNEIDLTGIWQMREFVIRPGGGPLQQTTTKNNPREHQAAFTSVSGITPSPINLNGSAALLTEILASMSPNYAMPETSGGVPFMGGASTYNLGTFWDHPALSTPAELEARFRFSSNTCSGCHTGETNTLFYHIRPAGPGGVPTISAFLQGPLTVTDNRGLSHSFAEMDNRKQALASLANQLCSFKVGIPPFQVLRVPLPSVH